MSKTSPGQKQRRGKLLVIVEPELVNLFVVGIPDHRKVGLFRVEDFDSASTIVCRLE
jgi:hypothetical protein